MNNAADASSLAQPGSQRNDPINNSVDPAAARSATVSSDGAGSRTRRASVSARAKEGLVKKLQFLTNLAHNLDMLVFAELCAMYYME